MNDLNEPSSSGATSRRDFLKSSAVVSAAAVSEQAGGTGAGGPAATPAPTIGFHTDAFNSVFWNFDQCLDWAHRNQVHYIECGAVDGVTWAHGLGYQPHVALWQDPVRLRKKMDKLGIQFSQIDAAFPLSIPEGLTLGVEYVLHTLRWAKLAGCPRVDTTDDRFKPEGMTEREVMDMMRGIYTRIVRVAEDYDIVIDIEPHGYFTTKPDAMAEMLSFVDSPYLQLNLDTGNTYIAGQDPVVFVDRFARKISHVHIKDVSPSLAEASRGNLTGIPISYCAVGEGVNAKNIVTCVEKLIAAGFNGTLSIECEGQGGPLIERSLAWLRGVVTNARKPAEG